MRTWNGRSKKSTSMCSTGITGKPRAPSSRSPTKTAPSTNSGRFRRNPWRAIPQLQWSTSSATVPVCRAGNGAKQLLSGLKILDAPSTLNCSREHLASLFVRKLASQLPKLKQPRCLRSPGLLVLCWTTAGTSARNPFGLRSYFPTTAAPPVHASPGPSPSPQYSARWGWSAR